MPKKNFIETNGPANIVMLIDIAAFRKKQPNLDQIRVEAMCAVEYIRMIAEETAALGYEPSKSWGQFKKEFIEEMEAEILGSDAPKKEEDDESPF